MLIPALAIEPAMMFLTYAQKKDHVLGETPVGVLLDWLWV